MPTSNERQRDRERWWRIHNKETYVCPDCGRTQNEHEREWHVHHLKGVQGNVVALCESCHKIRHGGDPKSVDLQFWKEEFLSLGGDKNVA